MREGPWLAVVGGGHAIFFSSVANDNCSCSSILLNPHSGKTLKLNSVYHTRKEDLEAAGGVL